MSGEQLKDAELQQLKKILDLLEGELAEAKQEAGEYVEKSFTVTKKFEEQLKAAIKNEDSPFLKVEEFFKGGKPENKKSLGNPPEK